MTKCSNKNVLEFIRTMCSFLQTISLINYKTGNVFHFVNLFRLLPTVMMWFTNETASVYTLLTGNKVFFLFLLFFLRLKAFAEIRFIKFIELHRSASFEHFKVFFFENHNFFAATDSVSFVKKNLNTMHKLH